MLGGVPFSLSIEISPAGYWFERAMKLHCQVADSAYLAMALELKVSIDTFDGGLATAARANKAKVFSPPDQADPNRGSKVGFDCS